MLDSLIITARQYNYYLQQDQNCLEKLESADSHMEHHNCSTPPLLRPRTGKHLHNLARGISLTGVAKVEAISRSSSPTGETPMLVTDSILSSERADDLLSKETEEQPTSKRRRLSRDDALNNLPCVTEEPSSEALEENEELYEGLEAFIPSADIPSTYDKLTIQPLPIMPMRHNRGKSLSLIPHSPRAESPEPSSYGRLLQLLTNPDLSLSERLEAANLIHKIRCSTATEEDKRYLIENIFEEDRSSEEILGGSVSKLRSCFGLPTLAA